MKIIYISILFPFLQLVIDLPTNIDERDVFVSENPASNNNRLTEAESSIYDEVVDTSEKITTVKSLKV